MSKTGHILHRPYAAFAALMLALAALACTFTEVESTVTPLPPTFTPQTPATAVGGQATPSASATATVSPPTTLTATPTASLTLAPTSTPATSVSLLYDQYRSEEIDPMLRQPLTGSWLAFIQINQRDAAADIRTPQPETGFQTVYLARADTRTRVPVIELPVSVENRLYWSPTGTHMAFFLPAGTDPQRPAGGLYLLDLSLGVSVRLYGLETLQPRGIPNHQPVWSPDGMRLVVTLPTAYATDIFVVNTDGTEFRNLTNSPAYEFWPAWSPDGRYLAFVSDRDFCPTWTPGETGTCDRPDATSPSSGKLYLYDFENQTVTKVNDTVVNSAPEWINERYLSVSGGSVDLFAAPSDLWLYDIVAGSAWSITPPDGASYLNAAWKNDAAQVIYQRAAEVVSLVWADRNGNILNTSGDFIFPRFGVNMDWTPVGDYLAVGGRNGQCPYGLLVFDTDYNLIIDPPRNILACDPVYSPDGAYLAFQGVQQATNTTDGRVDIYLANPNGLGVRNLTANLTGRVQMLGWVGQPQSEP